MPIWYTAYWPIWYWPIPLYSIVYTGSCWCFTTKVLDWVVIFGYGRLIQINEVNKSFWVSVRWLVNSIDTIEATSWSDEDLSWSTCPSENFGPKSLKNAYSGPKLDDISANPWFSSSSKISEAADDRVRPTARFTWNRFLNRNYFTCMV